jgi:hypothetical protein
MSENLFCSRQRKNLRPDHWWTDNVVTFFSLAAAHRFAEVSLGILVALAVVAVWREERQLFDNTTAK